MDLIHRVIRKIVLTGDDIDRPLKLPTAPLDQLWRRVPSIEDIAGDQEGKIPVGVVHRSEVVDLVDDSTHRSIPVILVRSEGRGRVGQMEVRDHDGDGSLLLPQRGHGSSFPS